jgi:hypothetical protein
MTRLGYQTIGQQSPALNKLNLQRQVQGKMNSFSNLIAACWASPCFITAPVLIVATRHTNLAIRVILVNN